MTDVVVGYLATFAVLGAYAASLIIRWRRR